MGDDNTWHYQTNLQRWPKLHSQIFFIFIMMWILLGFWHFLDWLEVDVCHQIHKPKQTVKHSTNSACIFVTHKFNVISDWKWNIKKNLSIEYGFPIGTHFMGILCIYFMIYLPECMFYTSWHRQFMKTQILSSLSLTLGQSLPWHESSMDDYPQQPAFRYSYLLQTYPFHLTHFLDISV